MNKQANAEGKRRTKGLYNVRAFLAGVETGLGLLVNLP